MSAQAALAGMYPPTPEEKWHDEILWQPIPIHTVQLSMDHVLATSRHFPKYGAEREKYIKDCPEVQRIYTEHADLFSHWTQESGMKIESIGDVFQLYNTLVTEKAHNKMWVKFNVRSDIPTNSKLINSFAKTAWMGWEGNRRRNYGVHSEIFFKIVCSHSTIGSDEVWIPDQRNHWKIVTKNQFNFEPRSLFVALFSAWCHHLQSTR